jgi:hypothetical protein
MKEAQSAISAVAATSLKNAFADEKAAIAEEKRTLRVEREVASKAMLWFTKRGSALMAGLAVGIFSLSMFGHWASLAWVRSDFTQLNLQRDAVRADIVSMSATQQEMAAKGYRVVFSRCADQKTGRPRLCIAGEPGAQRWGTDAEPYYIPKGY